MYALNKRTAKYVKSTQVELKGEIDKYTILVGDFNTPHSIFEGKARWKISKNVGEYNSVIN